tara:strand:- start:12492 stop:12881 length:390 start_codon:yes stop_codon:yes gene_type:complete
LTADAVRTRDRIQAQILELDPLFERTLASHPDWWCQREMKSTGETRDWRTFFIKLEYRDLQEMNRAWALDEDVRSKKRRELVWVAVTSLQYIYEYEREQLWKRVRQRVQAQDTILSIETCTTEKNWQWG